MVRGHHSSVGRGLDDIKFHRVDAEAYANGKTLRDAVDIEINGESLSLLMDGAPFDVQQVRTDLGSAWGRSSQSVAILNCTCGEVACGGLFVEVVADAETVRWRGQHVDFSYAFDRSAFESSLRAALRDLAYNCQ